MAPVAAFTIDPIRWPAELMSGLTPAEQVFCIWRHRGLSQTESALAAGCKPSSVKNLRNQAYQMEQRPHVRRAMAALADARAAAAQPRPKPAVSVSTHEGTIYARPA